MSIIKKDEICKGLTFKYLKWGPFSIWRDSFTFRVTEKIFWNVNFSWPGYGTDNLIVGDNPEWGPGRRLEFTIWPFGYWLIGLGGQKFAKWTFKEGYRGKPRTVGHVCWHPPRRLHCKNLTGEVNRNGEMTSYCGGFRWHKCPYIAE